MRKLFRDDKLDAAFKKYGYVIVPVLDIKALTELRQFYFSAKGETEKAAFHSTHFSTDFNYKQNVHDTLKQFVSPAADRLLIDYRIAFANFMVKNAGGNNPMPLHADWSYVKEPGQVSIAIWIPLVDTTPENGFIGVIPYSHNLSPTTRGPRILQWNPPSEIKLIGQMGKLLPLKAGQALIYDHRLLHYSPANNSNIDRPAINLSLVPLNTQLYHYCVPEGTNEIHEFEVDDDKFFIQYNNFQMPEKGKLINKLSIGAISVFDEKVDGFIKCYNKVSWWYKLANLLSIKN